MERRKDETIANLERHYYDGQNNKENDLLREEIKRLEEEVKDLQAKNDQLQLVMDEKNQIIENSELIKQFYE